MHFEQRYHYSGALGRDMNFNVYGHAGTPVIVFPSSGGTHNEFADFGMIEACQQFIDTGQLRFYTPDSIDNESWLADYKSAHDKARTHDRYDHYIVNELVPLIRYENNWHGPMIATGCSMGGFHTINFALRHPDVFRVAIAFSGVYDARFFTGEYHGDMAVYHNSPIDYLWPMTDSWFLDQYRQNDYIICVGQGAWEAPHVGDTRRLQEVFAAKGIPGWFDYWGYDVAHDWVWWRQQLPHFLHILASQGKL